MKQQTKISAQKLYNLIVDTNPENTPRSLNVAVQKDVIRLLHVIQDRAEESSTKTIFDLNVDHIIAFRKLLEVGAIKVRAKKMGNPFEIRVDGTNGIVLEVDHDQASLTYELPSYDQDVVLEDLSNQIKSLLLAASKSQTV